MRATFRTLLGVGILLAGLTSARLARAQYEFSTFSAPDDERRRGENLHIRVGIGMGAIHIAGGGGRYDGAAIDFDFGIGKDVTPRDTILVAVRATLAPSALGVSHGALDGFRPSFGALGLSYLRYVVPRAVYLGAGLDAMFISFNGPGTDSPTAIGPSVRFLVGREWPVAEGIALGIAGTLVGAYAHSTSSSDTTSLPSSLGVGEASLAFTITFH